MRINLKVNPPNIVAIILESCCETYDIIVLSFKYFAGGIYDLMQFRQAHKHRGELVDAINIKQNIWQYLLRMHVCCVQNTTDVV